MSDQEQMSIPPGERARRRDPGMPLGGVWAIVLAAAVGAGAYFYLHRTPPPEPPEPTSAPRPPLVEPAPQPPPPAVSYRVPETPPDVGKELPPLPELASSDTAVREALAGALGAEPLARLLMPEDVIRRVVATLDALPRDKVPMRIRAVPPVAGALATEGSDNELTLSAANQLRYAPLMQLVGAIDVEKLAEVYIRFYPLFQEAYEELGFPDRYFNDRLIEVIDHLLATPPAPDPIRLVRPGVFYRFADPDLEARSAGQKALLRLGRENAQVIQAKLEALRLALAR